MSKLNDEREALAKELTDARTELQNFDFNSGSALAQNVKLKEQQLEYKGTIFEKDQEILTLKNQIYEKIELLIKAKKRRNKDFARVKNLKLDVIQAQEERESLRD